MSDTGIEGKDEGKKRKDVEMKKEEREGNERKGGIEMADTGG